MDDNDVYGRVGRYAVRRIRLPERAVESFTVIGPDLRPVVLVDEYLAWLTDCERPPNTVEAYAHTPPGRYQPPDTLLAFLESLTIMPTNQHPQPPAKQGKRPSSTAKSA